MCFKIILCPLSSISGSILQKDHVDFFFPARKDCKDDKSSVAGRGPARYQYHKLQENVRIWNVLHVWLFDASTCFSHNGQWSTNKFGQIMSKRNPPRRLKLAFCGERKTNPETAELTAGGGGVFSICWSTHPTKGTNLSPQSLWTVYHGKSLSNYAARGLVPPRICAMRQRHSRQTLWTSQ